LTFRILGYIYMEKFVKGNQLIQQSILIRRKPRCLFKHPGEMLWIFES
jgi:hypothetical protein